MEVGFGHLFYGISLCSLLLVAGSIARACLDVPSSRCAQFTQVSPGPARRMCPMARSANLFVRYRLDCIVDLDYFLLLRFAWLCSLFPWHIVYSSA